MLEEQLIANLQKFGCGYIIIFYLIKISTLTLVSQ